MSTPPQSHPADGSQVVEPEKPEARPTPTDTFGTRIKKYQRREQMATWVVAGVAALIAFVAAHALEGTPRLFTSLVFTCAIGAGLTAALTRVQFEWQATLLKRRMKELSADSSTQLDQGNDQWPSIPEHCWEACLCLISLSWAIMLVGIWWPRATAQTSNPPFVGTADLQTFRLGAIGPFADCDADLPLGFKDQMDALIRNYRSRIKSDTRGALIILVGAADNRRLTPKCAIRFKTNEQLAATRAANVREQWEAIFSGETLKPRFIVLTSGPRHLEASREAEGRSEDRTVDVWVAVAPQLSLGS